MVVRRSNDDFTLVLVPGDRVIDWVRLRNHLGVRRLSLARDAEALTATGYRPGTITPLGVDRSLPVVADAALAGAGKVSVGAGAPGVAVHLDADDLLELTGAVVGEVTKPAGFGPSES
jgi:prolyl-tRNA editing enzyme YbaK/EbsC (Cys-tRNA(Pro) deacylase)